MPSSVRRATDTRVIMVFRLVSKMSLWPLSLRSLSLNIVALLSLSSILLLATHILTPFHQPIRPIPYPVRLIPDRSFIALSVDDFGRWADSVPLFPDSAYIRNHSNLLIPNNVWYRRATVETQSDLDHLHLFLHHLNRNVSFDQRAGLTPHWVVGGPDFNAMRAAGCDSSTATSLPLPTSDHLPHSATATNATYLSNLPQTVNPLNATSPTDITSHLRIPNAAPPISTKTHHTTEQSRFDSCQYRERLLSDGGPTGLTQSPYLRGDLKPAYKALWTSGLWNPEYHGRSHFNVARWLGLLKSDQKAQNCFRHNMVCATDGTQLRSELSGISDMQHLRQWIQRGMDAFTSFWGYRPVVISSPHNTWSTWLANIVSDMGFVGAELAEDQAGYIKHSTRISLHDRYRFDVFFPGFNCVTAIEEIVQLLQTPVTISLTDRWYQFLSMIDLFRTHRRLFYPGVGGGDHRRFISLMWHAQNAMTSTYSDGQVGKHTECFRRAIQVVRSRSKRTVFVTASELHQIRTKGWSMEVWSDSFVLRNYALHGIHVTVPDLSKVYEFSEPWNGRDVIATAISAKGVQKSKKVHTSVGKVLSIGADTVVRLTRR